MKPFLNLNPGKAGAIGNHKPDIHGDGRYAPVKMTGYDSLSDSQKRGIQPWTE